MDSPDYHATQYRRRTHSVDGPSCTKQLWPRQNLRPLDFVAQCGESCRNNASRLSRNDASLTMMDHIGIRNPERFERGVTTGSYCSSAAAKTNLPTRTPPTDGAVCGTRLGCGRWKHRRSKEKTVSTCGVLRSQAFLTKSANEGDVGPSLRTGIDLSGCSTSASSNTSAN